MGLCIFQIGTLADVCADIQKALDNCWEKHNAKDARELGTSYQCFTNVTSQFAKGTDVLRYVLQLLDCGKALSERRIRHRKGKFDLSGNFCPVIWANIC